MNTCNAKFTAAEVTEIIEAKLNESLASGKRAKLTMLTADASSPFEPNKPNLGLFVGFDIVTITNR